MLGKKLHADEVFLSPSLTLNGRHKVDLGGGAKVVTRAKEIKVCCELKPQLHLLEGVTLNICG